MKKNIIEKNKEWFNKNEFYSEFVLKNETYKNIKEKLDREVNGIGCLLDIGNGGLFNYDISLAGEIHAVDLFFDDTNEEFNGKIIHFKKGTALSLPYNDNSFDGIIIVSLLHHLVGDRFIDIKKNICQCFNECFRVMKPGGKLIIHEPWIPSWFLFLEKAFYKPIKYLIGIFFKHPLAIQLTPETILNILAQKFKINNSLEIEKKGTLIHFGVKFPAVLSPVKAFLFVAKKDE